MGREHADSEALKDTAEVIETLRKLKSGRPKPFAAKVTIFQTLVWNYFANHGRFFPWRTTTDPYRILVSEVMLQQTQTDRVLPKYMSFLARFPSVNALAASSLRDILEEWQGLGYNRRGRALHELGVRVAREYGGHIPSELSELKSLPGIGDYTARAVRVFAFGGRESFIETNIRTVYLTLFFPEEEGIADRDVLSLVEATLPEFDVRSWYYGLMDLGVYLKRKYPLSLQQSAHYKKQSSFKGSRRQLRAHLVREVLKHPRGLTRAELEACRLESSHDMDELLEDLVGEGMLVIKGKRFTVA